ncbi:MAG: succinate dehydrogenase, hydrophobic membrane anchor protein [Alphaproteobacteria bacterium]
MSIRTPLARVRGLGAAKTGVGHFWAQRLTAVALVPLTIWFLGSIIAFAGADYDTVTNYLRNPVVTVLFVLFLGTAFTHMKLGLRVVVEDYITRESTKIALLVLIDFFTYATAALAIFSVLQIAWTHP